MPSYSHVYALMAHALSHDTVSSALKGLWSVFGGVGVLTKVFWKGLDLIEQNVFYTKGL